MKFLRAPISENICERLLLFVELCKSLSFNPLRHNVVKWSGTLAANAARFLKCV